MKKTLLIVPILALIMLLPSFAQAALVDDGYHFNQFSSSPNVADYGEWWYFNLNQPDVKAAIQYSLWDPTGATPFSFGLMYVSIQRANTNLDVFYPISWSYVVTSDSSANLVMGPDQYGIAESISVDSSGVYTLNGVVADVQGNTVAWNLQYIQQVPSLSGIRHLKTAPGEEMNWYVQMPSAIVYGAIIVNGETIVVNGARGYHDHNYGVWKLSDTVWNWFETNTPNTAIVGYDFYSMHKGQITVQLDGQTITFTKNQYVVLNRDLTTIPALGLPFPQKTTVLAFNGKNTLILNINVNVAETGFVARDYPTATWIVLESNAVFTGTLITGCHATRINSVGFREYAIDVPNPSP